MFISIITLKLIWFLQEEEIDIKQEETLSPVKPVMYLRLVPTEENEEPELKMEVKPPISPLSDVSF